MKKISFTLSLVFICLFSATAQNRSTFENLTLAPNSYYDGSDLSGGFASGDAYFYNYYDTTYQYWASGFIYSNVKNDTTAGYTNEYAAATTSGVFGSNNYAVGYTGGGQVNVSLRGFAPGHQVLGFYLTNSTYAYLSMKNGDAFAKKFGGATGNDPDWFKVTVRGYRNGALTTDSVDAYLADFRSANNSDDYILKSWKFVNLLSLGNVDSLAFELTSTDNGMYGMNTPAYFCLDNFMTTDGASIVLAPVANNDAASVVYTDSVRVNVLANDVVSTFLYGTVTLLSGPQVSGANAYIDANNQLVYVPLVGIRTTDTLVYSYCDEFNTCDTATAAITISGLTNTVVNDVATTTVNLYPIPAHSQLTIVADDIITTLSISDVSGREVLARDVQADRATVDVSALSAGVYTVSLRSTHGTVVKRLIRN